MSAFTTRDVARILALPPAKVRRYARSDLLQARRGLHNEYQFSFQDLVLLRTALELEASRVPPRRIHRALRDLRDQLPPGRPLSAVRIAADGDHVVVTDGTTTWNPDSRQMCFDFSVADLAARVASLGPRSFEQPDREPSAAEWYELGVEHEAGSPLLARELYRRALEADPRHADARVNLGRLLHEEGRLEEARRQYVRALAVSPDHATAAFNLGVVLEDMGRAKEARDAYVDAVAADPRMADAHYNLSGLCEVAGDRAAALRHLRSYRELIRTS
ncbi:hypothetical protein BH18GEM1_BH18GEM1_08360 [soil metagenome]